MRLSPVPVFVLYQLFCTVKKASPGSVYRFYSGRFSDPGAVSVFPRSILCTPSGSISCSGSCMQRSLLLRHLVRRKTNSSFSFWGIFLFLLAFCLQNRTEAAECLEQSLMKLRDDSTEKNLLLEEKNRMLAEKQDYEIYAATLKERNRIAREIHDNVGHLLSRSILITGAAKAINASDALSPVLDDLDHSLNQAMTSIRTSVHDLHDESLNLKEAAESLTSDFTFCPVTLNYDMGFEVPREIKYCFISIVKEALSNVARHSNATLVQITMREHPALYQLCIEDNGTLEEGLSLSENNREALFSSRGIGLSNMNDRLKILNGNLQITIQKGFRLFITIPKEQEY